MSETSNETNNVTIEEQIVNYLRRNRVSTTEVADCLGKSGAIDGVFAVNRGMYRAGKVRYIYGCMESNWTIHEQARYVQQGEIVIMGGIEVNNRALVGELVTKFITLYQGAEAVVMLGKARDVNDIIKQRYPVWCKGYSPIGCFNTKEKLSTTAELEIQQQCAKYDGSIAVCDDTGVVIIPKENVTKDFLRKLEFMEEQEDTWFECIDKRKWNTYDTVCLKKYKQDDIK